TAGPLHARARPRERRRRRARARGAAGGARPSVRKRLLLAAGILVLLGGGAAGVYVLYVRHAGRDVRGSPTVEFTPTLAPPKPLPAPHVVGRKQANVALTRVDWPLYGYDPARLRWVPSALRPPYRRVWTFRALKLVEFPPVIAYGRLFFANNGGTIFAVPAANGRRQWRL